MNKRTFARVFLIAGSEPLGSAGMQGDIKAVSACGGYAAGALTCIVDEDTTHVKSIFTIPKEMIVSQAESYLSDVGANCIKTGMLYSAELIEAVAHLLKNYPETPLLVDPVMVNSGGEQLIQTDAINTYKEYLFPMARIITPNRREAELLLGRSLNQNQIEKDLEELCQWGNSVVVKSVPGDGILLDFFRDNTTGEMMTFPKKIIDTKNVNGTGDTFASAIATYIARGYRLSDAVVRAESFIHMSIKMGAEYAFGAGYGPVHPFFRTRTWFEEEDIQYNEGAVLNNKQ